MDGSEPNGRSERKPREVRERILNAALAILSEAGIQRLTQVQVSKRAGIRQSHLTYYFPTRDDLLEAVTARGVDGIASSVRRAVGEDGAADQRELLERLATAVAELEHMRMFVAMIVEADGDETVRGVMRGATGRMEAALAEALGDGDVEERARVVLAALWGLGLYQFLMRPTPEEDLKDRYVSWLAEAAGVRRASLDDEPVTFDEPGRRR